MSGSPSRIASFALTGLLGAAVSALAAPEEPLVIGEHRRDIVLETPHPYPAASAGEEVVWSDRYRYPGARYLVFEFQRFDLAPGDRVEVRDPKGEQVHVYRGRGPRGKGGDFITKMVLGPEAVIELHSRNPHHEHYGYRIERITRGYGATEMGALAGGPEALCGVPDQEDAACYETAFPEVFERSRPVARIVMDGLSLCTAWIVSCEDHLITNSHCTWDDTSFDTQGELDRMEFQFGYQDTSCGGADAVVERSFLGGTFLENDRNLDYSLIQAPAGEEIAAVYGWLTLDDRLADVDEPVYIVGHPGGRPKEIALYSSEAADQDNPDGFCEVFSTDEPVCVDGTAPEIGYFCDTEGGSSGSPVLSRNTHKVVALHHCANCPNRGVRIQEIWDNNQAGPNPLPACSLYDKIGSVELDRGRYGCSDRLGITVADASLGGTGSAVVTAWSDSEGAPEVLALPETSPGSGRFAGGLDTTAAAPSGNDGLLSVADGDRITVRYVDADDGQGGTDVAREVTAVADCVAPTVSDVNAVTYGNLATILWSTDEPADSRASYTTAPPAWSDAGAAELVSAHAVELSGLAPCTDHLYWVQSVDEAGNLSFDDAGGAYHRFTAGVDVMPTYASADTPLEIADLSSTASTIQVLTDETVVDLDVGLNVTHTYVADLDLYLKGPAGQEVRLSSDNGGAGQDLVGTVFDDEAAVSITAGSAPFTGRFIPEQPLSTFEGWSGAGDWTLRVFDDATGDTGALESWSLMLTLPPRPCGPHAAYASHALAQDACALGGQGDGDERWDAGEEVRFLVALENDGTDPLTGVRAIVSPLVPGVTVMGGTVTYGTLQPGQTVLSPALFSMHLADNLTCGLAAGFRIDIAADQGSWSDTFVQEVGETIPPQGTALAESFDTAGIPPAWTIVNGGGSADTWFADDAADPLGCASFDPNPPIAGTWAAVDSDCAGEVAMDESLITPVLDLSGALTATLEFDHYLYSYGVERAELSVRSTLTGGSWSTLRAWTASTANPVHEIVDITAEAGGAADVEVRWRYYDANFDWYWYVDNVLVTFTSGGGCGMSLCATGSPPGEQGGAGWPTAAIYSWDPDPQATGGYALYRGVDALLARLVDATLDSCVRFAGAGPGDTMVDLSADVPPPGRFYWYLVTGWNEVGEGSPGDGATGLRIVDDLGPCGP